MLRRDLGASAVFRGGSHLFVERDVSILTRRPGIILEVRADRGARVVRGQVLCVLENKDLELAVEVARLEVEKAQAAFERAGRLKMESAISKETYEETEFKLKSSERSAEIAEQDLEKSFVRAPFEGVVSARNVEIGQVLAVDDTRVLFRVTAPGPLLARLYVPQWAYAHLEVGAPVDLRPDVSPSSPVEGRVRFINDVLDAASSSAEVIVEVTGREKRDLRPGMSVVAELRFGLPPGRLTVARSALRETTENGEEAEVTVRREGEDRIQRVRLGFRGDDRVEILAGLEQGDIVVLPEGASDRRADPPPAGR
jgi:RND family efflux transporter MFP subunit